MGINGEAFIVRLRKIYDRRVITMSRGETRRHANDQLRYRFRQRYNNRLS